MRLGPDPDDEDVRQRRVRDPHLSAVEDIAVCGLLRGGFHPRGVGAGIGFGQAEATDEPAFGEAGEVAALLRLGPVGVKRIHHEARLHRHHRAVAGIDPLDLARNEAVGHVARAETAVFFGDGRAEKARLAHLGEDVGVGRLSAVGLGHAGGEAVFGKGAGGIAQEALVLGEEVVEAERIGPVEGPEVGPMACGPGGVDGGGLVHGGGSLRPMCQG